MKIDMHSPPYFIAEIGANHNGDLELARKMMKSAKDIGCDCVKFQSFNTKLFAKEVYNRSAFLGNERDVKSDLRTAVETYSLNSQEITSLRDYARQIEIEFASSVFEPEQVQTLIDINADFIKIASMDVTNDSLLRCAARAGRTIVLSTGMATLEEIAHAVETIEGEGHKKIILLHCVSLYPPPDNVINLNNIVTLKEAFGYPVGFSDHTKGNDIALGATAKGAVVIEKHFTLDHTMEGWDHAMSAQPEEMLALVEGARRVYAALGSSRRVISEKEHQMAKVMRRSIVTTRALKAGDILREENLTYRRPGTGIAPNLATQLIGLKVVRDVSEDAVLQTEDLGIVTSEG